jgi:hypothetical protein
MVHQKPAYWICTGLFCAVLGFSGVVHLTHVEFIVESMAHLGYPEYLLTILGLAKLLGVVAVLAPGHVLLKEWAYAGLAFDLLGASASHAFSGDAVGEVVPPLIVLMIGAASYVLRPVERRLTESPAIGGAENAPVAHTSTG